MPLPKRKKFKWNLHDNNIKNHIEHSRDIKWESQNGKITLLRDMDTNHIKNCLAKNERENYGFMDNSVMEALKLELIYRQLINFKKENNEPRKLRRNAYGATV